MLELSEILAKLNVQPTAESFALITNDILKATECSPFLKRLLMADQSLLENVVNGVDDVWSVKAMWEWLEAQPIADEASLKKAVRQLRQHVIARLILRDLSGRANLQEVMLTNSYLAEVTVNFAIQHIPRLSLAIYGEPIGESGNKQALIVVGMGKLGGYELNVSSDIDLIFAFEEDGETNGQKSCSNAEYFTHVCKRLISVIDEITEDGFVFRVDMRLRPYGSEGPLVASLTMLEDYYQQQGREWERYAWIKGRVIAGPAKTLTKLLQPFVYRKYLDYGAISSMRDLKVQIQRDVNRRDLHENIKLGRGGIREIEFIAQVFQLMRGGQDVSLQIRATLDVLKLLANQSLIEKHISSELQESYVFLRNLEHRLQYYNDQQTHDLPEVEAHRAMIAKSMGMPDWDTLDAEIKKVRAFVSQQFSDVFAYETDPSDEGKASSGQDFWNMHLEDAVLVESLEAIGYQEPNEAMRQLQAFKGSFKISRLPDLSRMRLNALMPAVIQQCGKRYNANETLARMIVLLETICRRASYLAFFVEYPHVLDRVLTLIASSAWVAGYLTQHPILLDGLLDVHATNAELDIAAQESQLMHRLQLIEGDTEQQMNLLRDFQQARLFALAAEDVINHIPLAKLSSQLSDLADMILRVVLKTVWPTVKGHHIEVPKFAIIAYGKHGGREMGYMSDLDMVFLYDDDHPDAREIYTRLGLKIIAWLNTMTSSGILYETDMQLRPDGGSGLLVSSIESFAIYQHEKAWVWEHQAITRARFAAGDESVGQAFEKIRIEIITKQHNLKDLRQEITHMRQRMKSAYRYVPGRFDLKHGLGGMIDIEFIVQYLVLAYSHQSPKLCENRANVHILRLCSVLGLIPPELGQQAADAYLKLRAHQHAMRLQGYLDAWVPEDQMQAQSGVIRELWRKVFLEEQ